MNPAAATQIEMPRLSDSMEVGTILAWLFEPGEQVGDGDDLVEIEIDRANMTYQAADSGRDARCRGGTLGGNLVPTWFSLSRVESCRPRLHATRPAPTMAESAPVGPISFNVSL